MLQWLKNIFSLRGPQYTSDNLYLPDYNLPLTDEEKLEYYKMNRESHTGTCFEIENTKKENAANPEYFVIRAYDEIGKSTYVLMLTEHQLVSAIKRANNNPEDIPLEIRDDFGDVADLPNPLEE